MLCYDKQQLVGVIRAEDNTLPVLQQFFVWLVYMMLPSEAVQEGGGLCLDQIMTVVRCLPLFEASSPNARDEQFTQTSLILGISSGIPKKNKG